MVLFADKFETAALLNPSGLNLDDQNQLCIGSTALRFASRIASKCKALCTRRVHQHWAVCSNVGLKGAQELCVVRKAIPR